MFLMACKKPELSIVIPTLNEDKYLPKLLESIKVQTYKDYEIIVFDSSSDDKTVEIAESFGARVFCGSRKGPGNGRNEGAKHACGKYLLFLDADVILPKKVFLKNFMMEINANHLKLANCFHFLYPFDVKDIPANIIVNVYYKICSYRSPIVPGFFIFIERNLFNLIDGFDESLTVCEDVEFVRRANEYTGFKMLDMYIYFSNRRLEHEGRLKMSLTYLYLAFGDFLPGFLKSIEINYQFGHYDKKNEEKVYDLLMSKVNSFFVKYKCQVSGVYGERSRPVKEVKEKVAVYMSRLQKYVKRFG